MSKIYLLNLQWYTVHILYDSLFVVITHTHTQTF